MDLRYAHTTKEPTTKTATATASPTPPVSVILLAAPLNASVDEDWKGLDPETGVDGLATPLPPPEDGLLAGAVPLFPPEAGYGAAEEEAPGACDPAD